jgi:cytochrome c nitrite reductase small subunit
MLAAAAVGVAVGIGLFTFGYARGASYLTDRPEACANCHVMREHHEGWRKSSHRAAAVCNDCHTPAGLVPRYAAKAVNGFFHSTAFTTGRFPDVIRITARNRAVTEGACLGCHAGMVDAIARVQGHPATRGCIVCHAGVGHR